LSKWSAILFFGDGGAIQILRRMVNYHNESYQTGVVSARPEMVHLARVQGGQQIQTGGILVIF
jgi:hypothetical protein